MSEPDTILIVGAGPVGLVAALELTRFGRDVRIIDMKEGPSRYSKAMGINTRTLELLEPSGVTPRLLEQGVRIGGVQFGGDDRPYFSIDFSRIPGRYNFMVGLPQSATERILEARLKRFGVLVEHGSRFETLQQAPDHVTATVFADGHRTELRARYLIGADGAHSPVRRALDIDFPGTTSPDQWSLADVRAGSTLDNTRAHVFFRPDGVLFMLRFREDVYRVASNRPDVLSRLPAALHVDDVLWQSDFRVSHRQASRYGKGRCFLTGDAAHIHSPLGARGMNMGIEDACTLAVCLANDRPQHYGTSRHRAGAAAIRMVRTQNRLATSASPVARLMRTRVLPRLLRIDPLHRALAGRMLGLGYGAADCDYPYPRPHRSDRGSGTSAVQGG
jgi:2-polyprenyl-6-methoxyphenol hydroxylase-like FAD-dependent oxidoreductase